VSQVLELPSKLERLVEQRIASHVGTAEYSARTGAKVLPGFDSSTAVSPDQTWPSRSERRHAAAEEFFERSVLLLLVLLVLLGGAHVVLEGVIPQEVPKPSLEIPNLNGAHSLEEAREMAGEDFAVEGVPVESGEPVGTVVSQEPKAGGAAVEGSTIHVRISDKQVVALPAVEGKTLEEAEQSIEGRPFDLEVKTVESSLRELGKVLEQEPEGGAGVTAEAGTHVTVVVGGGPSTAKSR
jgi:beta-lactam-binding protein with PASTA domain